MTMLEENHSVSKLQFRRSLRQGMTEAERVLWHELRNRKLHGSKWRRQANIGQFIADFRCPEHRLIVEVDGGIHEMQKEHDQLRTTAIADYHERVLRFKNEEVLKSMPMVLQKITEAMETSHPRPPLHSVERG